MMSVSRALRKQDIHMVRKYLAMRNFCANQLKIMTTFMTKLRVVSSLILTAKFYLFKKLDTP